MFSFPPERTPGRSPFAANRFGPGRDRVALTRVDPTVVAEVSVDALNRAGCGVIRCDSSATGRSCIRQTYLSFLILEPPLSGTVELPQHAETGQGAELLLSVPSRSWRQSHVRTSSTIWTAPKRT